MNEFQKALAELQAADLSFLAPATTKAAPTGKAVTTRQGKTRRKTRSASGEPSGASEPMAAINATAPSATQTEPTAIPATKPDTSFQPLPTTEPELPVFVPPAKRLPKEGAGRSPDTVARGADGMSTAGDADTTTDSTPRKRNRLAHEWPPIGATLIAEYFGVTYRAEIVAARKKLKSGRQIRLLDGPGKGKRLDSFSKAALVATARQRRTTKLGRKGMSSGWSFWRVAASVAS